MIGHLGPRVSALLDGQLPAAEEERAWAHLETCGACHAEVQRQGWVKTRLAGLTLGSGPDAGGVKTALLAAGPPPSGAELVAISSMSGMAGIPGSGRPRPRAGLAALGTGAAGVVALGMLALVAPPADAPVNPRQAPAVRPAELPRTPGVVPVRTGTRP